MHLVGRQPLAAVAPPPPMSCEEFAEAYKRGWKRTVQFLMSKGVNADTAEEIAQDAWGKGWIHSPQLSNQTAVIPWINSIAMNMLRSQLRRQPVNCDLPERSEPPKATPEHADFLRVLQVCGPDERGLLQAAAAGYTSDDIAQMRGCKASTVRVRLMRLRHRLARRFQ